MDSSCWSRSFQSGAVTDASLFSRRYSARSAFFDLLPVVGTAELGGSDLVFGDASREIMPTRSIGPQHEVKITCFVGVESGQKRILPGIGDWTRRQTCVPVSVIGAFVRQVGLVNHAAVAVFEQSRVDRGRIAIQLHPDFQTVLEYRRHHWPFLGETCFALDERRQRNRVMHVRIAV